MASKPPAKKAPAKKAAGKPMAKGKCPRCGSKC